MNDVAMGIEAAAADADVVNLVAMNAMAVIVVVHTGWHEVTVRRVLVDIDVVEMDIVDAVTGGTVVFLAEENP